ncbi:hypothetical protein [Dokdonia donghaensis]|uniref:hypothetical protein n=1 Tax=Dokdonia donghaensis TaxID=326320 RepID=UPI0035C856A1
MNFSTSLRTSIKSLSLSALAATLLVACSASQQVYDDDGIYSSNESANATSQEANSSNGSNTQVYKNYFEKGAQELGELEGEGAIFTDIEEYSSEDGNAIYVDGTDFESATGYGAWGDEVQDVQVTIYNNSPIWGWNRWGGLGWNGGFGWGRGFGWGGNFWSPWYGGAYYNPFWGGGFAYYSPFYYYGNFNRFNNFNYGYANHRYNGNRVAYSAGRRSINSSGRRMGATDAIAASRSRLRTSSRSRATYSRNKGTARPTSSRNGTYRNGVSRGTPNSAQRPSTGSRPNTYSRPSSRTRPTTRPNSRPTRPSGTQSRPSSRPSGSKARPSSRPSRPMSRPSSSSRRSSYSRPSSSSSRSSGSRSTSSSSRSGGRRG